LIGIEDPLSFIFEFALLQKESGLKVSQFREVFLAFERRFESEVEGFDECPHCGFNEIYIHRHLKMTKGAGYGFAHCAKCDHTVGNVAFIENESVFVAGGVK